jgi:hypothetical protein
MGLLLAIVGWRRDVEAMMGLAVRVQAPGAAFDEWDVRVATVVMTTGRGR